MGYLRYVAIGDSQTEGLNDGDEVGGYRGWADRLAGMLGAAEPGFRYANLAVRGQLAGRIRAEQLGLALAMEPDLVSVMGGMNDLVRPRFDAGATAGELEAMFAAGTAAGATVVTFTFPDIGRVVPLAKRLRPRVVDLNARIRAAADRHGVLVVDTFPYAVTCDPRLWSTDRLHASPLGHARIAAAAAEVLGVPGSDRTWADPLAPSARAPRWRRVQREAVWAGAFLGPWVVRRVRGRSSGDGRVAKRPELLPV